MVSWTEVERVKRDGNLVVESIGNHKMVKIYRLKDGSRRKTSSVNVKTDEEIPDDEKQYKTAWKCYDCGVELKSIRSSINSNCE